MTIYFKYRLDKAGIDSLQKVWILSDGPSWVVADIEAELTRLYPGVRVRASSCPQEAGSDLVLAPFMIEEHTFAWQRRALRSAAASGPRFLGLYELRRRRLTVVCRCRLPLLLFHLTFEQWFRAGWRVIGALKRRILTQASRGSKR